MSRRSSSLFVGLLWTLGSTLGAPLAVDARVLHLSALSFVAATSDTGQNRGETFGMLTSSVNGKFFANVPLEGGTVTKVTLCARDNDALDVTARLIAKPVNSFTDKTVMAQVATSGFDQAVRCFSTTAIAQPAIVPTSFAYFVELEFPNGNFIEVTGVQIEHLAPGVLVTGAGLGGGPHVRVFRGPDGLELMSFFAYDVGFTGGIRVAACDLNGDGVPDIVTGVAAGGGPNVRAFDGVTGAPLAGTLGSFFVYIPTFTGGVDVGCGPSGN